MVFFGQQRSIRAHGHHITVALHAANVQGFAQGRLYVVGTAGSMSRVFAQIHFGTVTVVLVIIVLMINEPTGRLIIMLVNHVYLMVFSQTPTGLVITTFRPRSRRTANDDVRILLFHSLDNHQIAFFKRFGNQVFVADTDILQIKRCRVSLLGTEFTPFRSLGVSVSPLNQIQHILYVFRHFVHRDTSLLSVRSLEFWQLTPAASTGSGSHPMSSQNWKYS